MHFHRDRRAAKAPAQHTACFKKIIIDVISAMHHNASPERFIIDIPFHSLKPKRVSIIPAISRPGNIKPKAALPGRRDIGEAAGIFHSRIPAMCHQGIKQ